jgi:5'-3' exonuclease
MGVTGLWTIIKAAHDKQNNASPTQVDFKGKIFCIDTSLWLYQFLRSPTQHASGSLLNNIQANDRVLLGFFNRICRLLFLGIRPIFVFDSAVPQLKRDTLQKRKFLRQSAELGIQTKRRKLLRSKLLKLIKERIASNQPHFALLASPPLVLASSDSEDSVRSYREEGLPAELQPIISQPNRYFFFEKKSYEVNFSDEEFDEVVIPSDIDVKQSNGIAPSGETQKHSTSADKFSYFHQNNAGLHSSLSSNPAKYSNEAIVSETLSGTSRHDFLKFNEKSKIFNRNMLILEQENSLSKVKNILHPEAPQDQSCLSDQSSMSSSQDFIEKSQKRRPDVEENIASEGSLSSLNGFLDIDRNIVAEFPDYGPNGVNLKEILEETENLDFAALEAQIISDEIHTFKPETDLLTHVKNLIIAFGCNYVDAPFEAEAQCAFLMNSGLVDGILTEDSDVLLYMSHDSTNPFFVYKDFFKRVKPALQLDMTSILRDINLDPCSVVELALILGCDYGPPLAKGIGPKLALDLVQFLQHASQEIFSSSEQTILARFDFFKRIMNSEDTENKLPRAIRKAQRLLKSVELAGFPDINIIQAFLNPQIKALHPSEFQWKVPVSSRILELLPPSFRESSKMRLCSTLAELARHIESGYWQTSLR